MCQSSSIDKFWIVCVKFYSQETISIAFMCKLKCNDLSIKYKQTLTPPLMMKKIKWMEGWNRISFSEAVIFAELHDLRIKPWLIVRAGCCFDPHIFVTVTPLLWFGLSEVWDTAEHYFAWHQLKRYRWWLFAHLTHEVFPLNGRTRLRSIIYLLITFQLHVFWNSNKVCNVCINCSRVVRYSSLVELREVSKNYIRCWPLQTANSSPKIKANCCDLE